MSDHEQQRLGEGEVTLVQYQNWAVLVKVALRKKDLWTVVSGEELKPVRLQDEEEAIFTLRKRDWNRKDVAAVEIILDHINFKSDVFTAASIGTDAFNTWKLIESLFITENKGGLFTLYTQLVEVKQGSDTVMKYGNTLRRVVVDLSNALKILAVDEGKDVDIWMIEKLQAFAFIAGLNKSFDPYKSMVASNPDGEWSFDKLLKGAQDRETLCSSNASPSF
ncbi:hypothetical protein SeLEV6574_g00257 [Synchytrium endobioticum]|uniref:DUF4219 domain-containing protein n=1 Tax=Synchytrium endobioticum TaxID=286115 RepID=A0A507DIY1_9FUNG|nr:hypothetical protein SeLEV6574_g00257 [Synchytrium endobioticum]